MYNKVVLKRQFVIYHFNIIAKHCSYITQHSCISVAYGVVYFTYLNGFQFPDFASSGRREVNVDNGDDGVDGMCHTVLSNCLCILTCCIAGQ